MPVKRRKKDGKRHARVCYSRDIMISLKRIYDTAGKNDGFRVLVDRLWPRGVSKEKADLDLWLKEIAPSDELRKWFAHDVTKWPEFVKRYQQELKGKKELLEQLQTHVKQEPVTLLFAAKDEQHNNAVVLKSVLEH